LLVSIDRGGAIESAWECARLAVECATAPSSDPRSLVVGVDFSGNPAKGKFQDFVEMLNMCRASGLKITVHAAEVPADEETDAVLEFAPDRIGHLLHLRERHFASMESAAGPPVELCPSSNMVNLHLDRSPQGLRGHATAARWLYGGRVPISINTDDTLLLGTTLSQEYALFAEAFNLSREFIANFVADVAEHSFLPETERLRLRAEIDATARRLLHTM